jgi:hypothetical protein
VQQSALLEYVVDKKNPATQESYASNIDYINGLKQQEEMIKEWRKSKAIGVILMQLYVPATLSIDIDCNGT